MYHKKAHIHFIGIGGVGMSGIATILRYQGYTISGCDADTQQHSVTQLRNLGCTVHHGNNTSLCNDSTIDIVVYSSAIKKDNPEIVRAQERGIPTISRGLMLAEIMRTKYSIAVAGMHGKTTTTSLISHILIESKKDPTVIIGGQLKNISTNARYGHGDFLVAEADESDRSLLSLQPTLAIVTNISAEHLDTYKDIDDIKQTFIQFLRNIPFYGKAIICMDNPHVRSLLPLDHIKFIKYGIEHKNDIWAENINLQADFSTFEIHTPSKNWGAITLHMPGIHNVYNCLASIAAAFDLEISFEDIKQACATFKGVDRRFTFRGMFKNASVYDDYGHHPHEILHTLAVAKRKTKKKVILVFQPHRFTRTFFLWKDFLQLFTTHTIDHLIMTDIYASSEDPIEGVTAEKLALAIQEIHPQMNVSYIPYEPTFEQIIKKIGSIAEDGDLVLLQGAGKITHLSGYLCPK